MELIEPADRSSVECPGFTTVEQCSQHYSLIRGNLSFPGYVVHTPQPPLQLAKGTACLGQAGCNVTIHWDGVGQVAAKRAELVDRLEDSTVTSSNTDWGWLTWWVRLAHSWLVQKPCFTRNSHSRSLYAIHFAIRHRLTRDCLSQYNNAGLNSEVFREVSMKIAQKLPFQKLDLLAYIFATDSMGLSSFKFLHWAWKGASFLQHSAYRPFKIIQCRWFWYESKAHIWLLISSSL